MGEIRQRLSQSIDELRRSLQKLYREFGPEFLETDPLKFPHRYSSPQDREVVAFLAATLAFGNVQAIFSTVERLLVLLGDSPYRCILNWPDRKPRELSGLYHRWISANDFHALLSFLRDTYRRMDSLEKFFVGRNVEEGLHEISIAFSPHRKTRGTMFMIPSPRQGSTCKRMNLFLRWMVRTHPPDFGCWKRVSPAHLYLPIDTHLARLVRRIGLTDRASPGWKMVKEVTERLRELDPGDPIRFDFSLSRLGILKKDPLDYFNAVG